MASHDYKIASQFDNRQKKRPSIQLAPSLQKPIFIISKNLNQPHILALSEQFQRHRINYQMQQETNTLGFNLNQRFFVVVDNRSGKICLGPEFGSILMTIIGYPKIGNNKKNIYCQTVNQVLDRYYEFKYQPDLSKRTKAIISGQGELSIIMQAIDQKSKIQLKSISKLKHDIQNVQASYKSFKGSQKKLIIVRDNKDSKYTSYIQSISLDSDSDQTLIMVKSVLDTYAFLASPVKSTNYVLANSKDFSQFVKNNLNGAELVIANFQTGDTANNKPLLTDDPNKIINAVGFDAISLNRILSGLGFSLIHTVPINSVLSIAQPKGTVREMQVIQEEKCSTYKSVPNYSQVGHQKKHQQTLEQISKQSIIKLSELKQQLPPQQDPPAHNLKPFSSSEDETQLKNYSSMNNSKEESFLSKSTNGKRKIKKIKNMKDKIKEYDDSKARNDSTEKVSDTVPAGEQTVDLQLSKLNSKPEEVDCKTQRQGKPRKRTLKSDENSISGQQKSKKSLKFRQTVLVKVDENRRFKSIGQFYPQTIEDRTNDVGTDPNEQLSLDQFQSKNKGLELKQSDSLFKKQNSRGIASLNGFLFQQFNAQFKQVASMIESQVSKGSIRPFYYVQEYDRQVRQLKNKLSNTNNCQYNFACLIEERERAEFVKYFQIKNRQYEEYDLGQQMANTNKFSQISNFSGKSNHHIFFTTSQPASIQVSEFGRLRACFVPISCSNGRLFTQFYKDIIKYFSKKQNSSELNQRRSSVYLPRETLSLGIA